MLLLSKDFGAAHPDDMYGAGDDDDEDDCSFAAIDTLSELSTRAPSSVSMVSPHGRVDVTLSRVEKQRLDWEAQEEEPPQKKESDLDALTLAFKKALDLDKKGSDKKKGDKCSPEVPSHVSCHEALPMPHEHVHLQTTLF